MKTTALAFCLTLPLCTWSMAQQPAPPPLPTKAAQPAAENYVLTLTMTNKEQKTSDLSLVVASADFNTSFLDAQFNVIRFTGTFTEEGDVVSVKYVLGGEVAVPTPNGTMYKSISTQATVRLRLGEPVQILKSDAQTCSLKVARLPEPPTSAR